MIIKSFKIFESNSNEILYKEILNAYEIDNFINNRVDMDQCDIDLIFDYIDTSDLKYLFLTRKVDKHSQDVNKKFIVFFGNGYHFRIYKLPDDYYFMFDLNVGNTGYQGNDNLCDTIEGVLQFLKDKIV